MSREIPFWNSRGISEGSPGGTSEETPGLISKEKVNVGVKQLRSLHDNMPVLVGDPYAPRSIYDLSRLARNGVTYAGNSRTAISSCLCSLQRRPSLPTPRKGITLITTVTNYYFSCI